ncbi:carboxymuconolactone decarboxylase family protein [Actinocrispum sp. NPDC049592]|uniref:carboxymuconolactone decarboxylase family protein n=1 Tax=Actinocrispum sp. NPDC049592 TaxID=3154835 RepID=UPI00343948BC
MVELFAEKLAITGEMMDGIAELTAREKVFLRLTADVCLGVPLGEHAGVSKEDVRRLLAFIAYDAGYSKVERLVREVGDDPEPVERPTGPPALPAEVQAQVRQIDPWFAEYVILQSDLNRLTPGLTERERAFVTMSIDIHYQTLGDTFRAHVGRALRAGATHEDLRAVLRFSAQFGLTRVWEAWHALNALLARV